VTFARSLLKSRTLLEYKAKCFTTAACSAITAMLLWQRKAVSSRRIIKCTAKKTI